MIESQDTTVLAIDGGGSRCRLACEAGGRVVQVETGPANVFTDFEGALTQIAHGLTLLAAKRGTDVETLCALPAFVGLAGVRSAEIAARVRWALPLRHARIADDRPTALRGALGRHDGAVIHCGTGSFYGVQRAGHIRLGGGWGFVLGDEGSAAAIGRMALNVTLRALDGTRAETDLTRALFKEVGGVEGALQFSAHHSPEAFGALAPQVTKAAASGDPNARDILQSCADHVSEAVQGLGWSEGTALCLTGGVAPVYKPYLPKALAAAIRDPLGTPLEGALSLAREAPDDVG